MARKNIELLKRLRTRLLRMRHEAHFNMGDWGARNECGTTACIAGHALLLQGYKLNKDEDFISPKGHRVFPMAAAVRELGLGATEAYRLFFNDRIVTAKEAAEAVGAIIEANQ